MKKTLLAAAVAALAITPAVQAAPEFYGRLDVSLSNYSADEDFGLDSSVNVESINNWVGIRGEAETNNDNLKVIYQIERRIDLTEGSGGLGARNTYLGLAGDSWGKVFLGTYDSVVKKAEGKVDQFNNTQADIGNLGISAQNRYKNTINYQSGDFSGLSFGLQVIPGEGNSVKTKSDGTPDSLNHSVANAYGASIKFAQNSFWANLAYEQSSEEVNFGGLDNELTTLRLSAGIDLEALELGFLYQQRDSGLSAHESKDQFVVSAGFNATEELKAKIQLTSAEATDDILYAGNYPGSVGSLVKKDSEKLQTITLGADYVLGKNVTTYALIGQAELSGKDAGGTKAKGKATYSAIGLNYVF